ncbi:MAG TPA: Uma2 family endonuclease [Candidatus Acidoferrum sp.]|jgi:Uma2 family endonuclease|nr:Uma2 family endonuclease [Candidatus Acidoferrum sp.]
MTDTVPTKRWTRLEYDRLIEKGVFGTEDRIELLGGALVVREPQGSPHAMGIRMAEEALRRVFAAGWDVRGQLPVALDDDSEPEPDISVVPGSFRDYRHGHPPRAVLIVEVAESSLSLDRALKGSLYARARVPEYWIVNLVDRALEVHRDPVADAAARYGWRYTTVATLRVGETVTPLSAPDSPISVGELIP